ncbi:hypothetical protein F4813DRAFT_389408 [Daldinia decipiens]|uniref:uncharacterized protein n=1 Tax=Daldinia decipiens TaxID=326647 RepID=UPI0020C1BB79|nr:uncharacterized protein F4813DRAFT_389408 [Daldinia decipiens]KAI1657673.1 hypothetical protein F4813DRAFT_389408 [Daldinia decipiens]
MATPPRKLSEVSSVKIQVGETEHLVNINDFPYFKAFIDFQQKSGQDTTPVPTHGDIPFFDVINYGVSNGFRHFFRRMPVQLSDYHTLCETLEFLAIDVLAGQKLRDIMNDLRKCKSDYDYDGTEIKGLKSIARDAAFRLLYIFLLGEFESEIRDRAMAYNTALFVLSHPGTFKQRTRKMVREAFEERFLVTEKQKKGLDEWPISDASKDIEDLEEGSTTDEDSYYLSDSDCAYWDSDCGYWNSDCGYWNSD